MSEQKKQTYCEAGGEYHDCVMAFYEIERPEPDVNFAGGITINGVWAPYARDLLAEMTGAEVAELEDRLLEYACEDADGYGDYLYQLRKDEGMRA